MNGSQQQQQQQQQHQYQILRQPPFFLIPGISPTSPISGQVQQIDQLNTLLLQEIDANFAKFHQVITSKILPEIKRFAIGAEPVREASQFWRSFFEAAAAVRLPIEGDSSHLQSVTNDSQYDSTVQHDYSQEQSQQSARSYDDSYLSRAESDGSFMFQPPVTSTPLHSRRQASESFESSMESPFEQMDRRLREDLRIDGQGPGGYRYAESESQPTPSLPSGYSLPGIGEVSTGTVEPLDLPQGYNAQSSAQAGPSRIVDDLTPKANKVGQKWNGLTDLRNTPLNARYSRSSRQHDSLDDSDDDLRRFAESPPVTTNFSLPPRAQAIYRAGKTPAKAAPPKAGNIFDPEGLRDSEARSIIDDLMEEMDSAGGYVPSPRMPTPDGLGRYSMAPADFGQGRRLFDGGDAGNGEREQRQSRRSLAADTTFGSDITDQPPGSDVYVNDNDRDSDYDESFDSVYGRGGGHTSRANQYTGGDLLGGDSTFMTMSPQPQAHAGDTSEAGQIFGGRAGQQGQNQFNLMQPDEINTYFGGKLEDAAGREVESSPLAQLRTAGGGARPSASGAAGHKQAFGRLSMLGGPSRG